MRGSDEIRATDSGTKLTYDDFVLFPDDGKRHELIDGKHYVTPSPNTRHQRIVGTLYGLIWSYLEANPIGEVFVAPYDVVFSHFDVVEPDLLYISNERIPQVVTPLHARGTPDLVVEVASKGTRRRDETIKRGLYERTAVLEYWVVDPQVDAVRIYRRRGGQFADVEELSRRANDTLTTDVLPGLELPLTRVFRD
jgi:Uma2 family endonuclease